MQKICRNLKNPIENFEKPIENLWKPREPNKQLIEAYRKIIENCRNLKNPIENFWKPIENLQKTYRNLDWVDWID